VGESGLLWKCYTIVILLRQTCDISIYKYAIYMLKAIKMNYFSRISIGPAHVGEYRIAASIASLILI
jgi:hypothetical protein